MKVFHPKIDVEKLPIIHCIPLKRILNMLGVKTIDIWILDVEGSELEVLKVS